MLELVLVVVVVLMVSEVYVVLYLVANLMAMMAERSCQRVRYPYSTDVVGSIRVRYPSYTDIVATPRVQHGTRISYVEVWELGLYFDPSAGGVKKRKRKGTSALYRYGVNSTNAVVMTVETNIASSCCKGAEVVR